MAVKIPTPFVVLSIAVIAIIITLVAILTNISSLGSCGCNGGGAVGESGFILGAPVYNASGIYFEFGQNTGMTFYGDWIFISVSTSKLTNSGINSVPVNFTTTDMPGNTVQVNRGLLLSGQTTHVDFPSSFFPEGGIQQNVSSGMPFYGYVWLGYCTSQPCSIPINFTKVGTIAIKSTSR